MCSTREGLYYGLWRWQILSAAIQNGSNDGRHLGFNPKLKFIEKVCKLKIFRNRQAGYMSTF